MTTKQIMEADEAGSFRERVCGQAGALIRRLRGQGSPAREPLDFGDGLLTPSCFGPGGGLTWETNEEKLERLKGRVI
jgi:hypothetical protein